MIFAAPNPYLRHMKTASAFFRLIRYPNLIFIGLTQLLFYIAMVRPAFESVGKNDPLDYTGSFILMAASILIAAGGYVINDYFDLNIDRINKPDKLVVDIVIKRRWAILWHFGFSISGLLLSYVVSSKVGNYLPFLCNVITVILLWFYSTTFKKQLLIGNVVISLLTGWVILVFYAAVTPIRILSDHHEDISVYSRIYKYAILYAGFAFIISLIREVIKDMEDMEGDVRYGCKTMPIVWGIPSTRLFVSVWLIVLIGALVVIQIYALQLRWWWSVLYSIAFLIFPLIKLFRLLLRSSATKDFHDLSSMLKWIMLTGIMSMLFFKWYHA